MVAAVRAAEMTTAEAAALMAANISNTARKQSKQTAISYTHIPHPNPQHTLAPVLPSLGLCLGARGYCSQRIRV
eukprot:scaffold117305_cov62-Phaeocystis_antarctica.AAC.2